MKTQRIMLILAILSILILSGCATTEPTVLGGDRDEHGCIGSAGYSWDEEKQECVRPWEEETVTPQDENQDLEGVGKTTMYLFVQNAASGSFIAVEGEDNLYTLSLNGISPQTIYFSDRPKRDVGQLQVQTFLDSMCFKEKNPPNAALEILGADDDSDVVVVELFDPIYNAEKHTLQYKAKILEDANHSMAVYNERHDKSIPQTFNEAALFIDDCDDVEVECNKAVGDDYEVCGYITCCQCLGIFGCGFQDDCCSANRCTNDCKKKFGNDCNIADLAWDN